MSWPFKLIFVIRYAVVASDGTGPRPVIGDSNAGSLPNASLLPGTCVRINTGAPVPSGSDAVVQVLDQFHFTCSALIELPFGKS